MKTDERAGEFLNRLRAGQFVPDGLKAYKMLEDGMCATAPRGWDWEFEKAMSVIAEFAIQFGAMSDEEVIAKYGSPPPPHRL